MRAPGPLALHAFWQRARMQTHRVDHSVVALELADKAASGHIPKEHLRAPQQIRWCSSPSSYCHLERPSRGKARAC